MRLAVVAVVLALTASAHAQAVDKRYAAPLTDGLSIPGTTLSGEFDARAVVFNAGGLALLRGPELALAVDIQNLDVSTSGGPGFGTYFGTAFGGDTLPRLGIGMGFEWLRPPRSELTPDPGAPFRFTLGTAVGLGKSSGFGIAWHHFHADSVLSGVDTFDLGLATRIGNYVGVGATLLDIATSPIGGVPIQRRYQLEASVRPTQTDRLELAIGGEVGETRGDVTGWARATVRVARGVFVMGNFEDRELSEVDELPAGTTDREVREYRATIGVELALGGAGVLASTTGVRDPSGADHSLGGTVVARLSAVGPASLIPPRDHLERIELTNEIDVRELTQIVLRLRRIAHDDTVKGVLVQFDGADAGWAGLQELRGELLALRKAGKKVFAYMLSGSGRDYFVASAADKIYLDPAGSLRLVGMAGQAFYFRGVFDQLGILPQFEKIAEYKSAPEELTEFGPTPIAAQMHADVFDSLFDQWIAAVADGRHLSIDAVKALVDNGPYDAGELADNTKLVDAVAAPDKVAELIAKEVGNIGIDSFSEVRPERWKRPKVAVIYVDGDITDGESKSVPVIGQTLAGGETLVSSLALARADSSIGAVILRIDSPGGSAVASELIAREVFALRKVKPILCSMSNVAASGGYFVAAGCDVIFAEPMTITGSIGIFSGKFDLSGLAKKLGVGVDTYKHGKNSDTESLFRPFTDEERAELLGKLRYMYGRFVGAVAEGRGMSKDAVDAVGRGHVYTGVQAEPNKLVDRFGGLGDTLDEAKRRMGLAHDTAIDVVELPKRPGSLFGVVGKLLGVHEQASVSLVDLPIFKELLRSVPASVLVAPDVPQARLPYDIRFAK